MNKLLLLFVLLFSLASCAWLPFRKTAVIPKLELRNVEISPGEVKLFKIPELAQSAEFKILCNNQEIPFEQNDNFARTYIAESYFSKLTPYTCSVIFEGDKTQISLPLFNVTVVAKKYPLEYLNVQKKKLWLSKEDLARVKREREVLKKIYANSNGNILFKEPFVVPLSSKITSPYGVKRLYNNKKNGQHLGIDYRAKVGHPIPSANYGKIVFAGDLFFTGNTVIIDHGLKIFTIYSHLSKINAIVGEYVPKGEIIGLAGMTGRVSGPHLHWGVKVLGHWINGDSLVETGI